MSTFSSVVNKSGKKFAPKATARRHVPSRPPPGIAPTAIDPPALTEAVVVSGQDASNPSDPSQAQSAAKQDDASAAPASEANVPRARVITTPANVSPSKLDSTTSANRTVDVPRFSRQAESVATSEPLVANQETIYNERTAKETPRAQQVVAKNDGTAHQHPAQNKLSHSHDSNLEERANHPPASKPSTKSKKAGTKRKPNFQATDIPDAVPRSSTGTSAPKLVASTGDVEPRKRRKLDPEEPRTVSPANPGQERTRMSAEANTTTTAPPAAAAGPGGKEIEGQETTKRPRRPKRKKPAVKSMAEVAAEVVADAAGDTSDATEDNTEIVKRKRRQKKRKIPQGAEDYQIAPTEVKMAHLVKDTGLGKGSKLEARLEEIDWDEVKKKRKQAEEEAEKQRELEREEKRTGRPAKQDDVPAAPTVPKMTLRDGRIALEEDSRVVDRHAEVELPIDDTAKELDVDDVTRRVNQSTIGRQLGVKQRGHWNEEMTDLFYKGLRMFGTDFMMISKMFPRMSRRHIKLKYTREERTNLARVHRNLVAKEDVDMEEYSQMSNQVYEDHEKVYEEIRADEKRLREDDEARRAREAEAERGDVAPEEGNVLNLRAQGTVEPVSGDEAETTAPETESSAKENRFDSVARSIVQQATAPKKAKKQPALTRKRERKKRTGLEGTEEVVGSIEDIPTG